MVTDMKKVSQISESIQLGIILAFAGGFMDAYSYLWRDEVFANAQTGNMLLFGVYLSNGDVRRAIRYLLPVCAFALGIFIADFVRSGFTKTDIVHWRQISVLVEAFILFGVSFMPRSVNLAANCLTSLACGIQVESFRKILGNGIATTMCIGNLRSATQNIFDFFDKGEKESAYKGMLYLGIIICFVIGAVVGNKCIRVLGGHAIAVASGFLIVSFFVMFIDLEKKNQQADIRK